MNPDAPECAELKAANVACTKLRFNKFTTGQLDTETTENCDLIFSVCEPSNGMSSKIKIYILGLQGLCNFGNEEKDCRHEQKEKRTELGRNGRY